MGYDPFFPVCEAQINVLCLPAARTTARDFEQCVKALQTCSIVSLRSVHRNVNSNDASKAPTFKEGSVLLDITTSFHRDEPPESQPLTSHTQPQIVLGIVLGEENTTNFAADQTSLEATDRDFQQYAASFHHACVKSTIVFGGHQPPASSGLLWVDVEGQGPAMPDVLAQVVAAFQAQLPAFVQDLKAHQPPSDTQQDSMGRTRETPISPIEEQRGETPTDSGTTQVTSVESKAESFDIRNTVAIGIRNLQAGIWPTALRHLSEGATEAGRVGDHLCHAKALESLLMCMILCAWGRFDFNIPQVCYPSSGKNDNSYPEYIKTLINTNRTGSLSLFSNASTISSQNLTELILPLIGTIMGLYERNATEDDSIISFRLACESRIRWTSLLVTMKKYGNNLQDAALRHIVEKLNYIDQPKSQSSSSSRVSIPGNLLTRILVESAIGAQTRLPIQRASSVLAAVAYNLSILCAERKEAFFIKEFLQRLGPALTEARRLEAAEFGVHPATGSSSPVRKSNNKKPYHDTGVHKLLATITQLYGLPQPLSNPAQLAALSIDRIKAALYLWSAAQNTGDIFMKLEVINLCAEISEAVPHPEDSLHFASYMLQICRRTVTISSGPSDLSPLISATDQTRLINNIRRAVDAAAKSGVPRLRAEYWDKNIVRDIRLLDSLDKNRLVPHSPRDLSLAVTKDNQTRKDPFIFNPFVKPKASTSMPVVAVGDFMAFEVFLQNPLDIDVEIEDITLITDECEFLPSHHSIVLGPMCCQPFVLTGIPKETGTLGVTGCRATIRGCYEEAFFILPDSWQISVSQKDRMRRRGAVPTQNPMSLSTKRLTVKVVEQVPRLSVVSTTLMQPSLMLLEGESTNLELKVRNDSDVDIDFVLLTFEDSVKSRLEEALNNKDLNPADTYEIQQQITTRPAIRWITEKTDLKILSQHEHVFSLEVLGQPGLAEVTIFVNYTTLGRPRAQVDDTFYTRQLSHTIMTTVNGSVDIPRCLVVPLQSDLGWSYREFSNQSTKQDQLFSSFIAETNVADQCILLLDVRNIWPQPLVVEFRARRPSSTKPVHSNADDTGYRISDVLQPGQMSRLLVLVPRIFIADPQATIPSLDLKRQFVVSASKTTMEAEAATREAFWYREKLLECLTGTWQEQNGGRYGQLDLRKGIRLSPRMIDALKLDEAEVSFVLKSARPSKDKTTNDSVIQKGDAQFVLRKNGFATLVTTVQNRTSSDLRLLLRLQPCLRNQPHNISLDLSKRFMWSGSLQRAIHPILRAGESRQIDLGVTAVSAGEFEVTATVEEVSRILQTAQGSGVGTNTERRVWYARRPCLIDVVDMDV